MRCQQGTGHHGLTPLQGHPYAWPTEDLLLTTITKGSCKTCGFFEDRLLPFVRVRLAGSVLLRPARHSMHVSVDSRCMLRFSLLLQSQHLVIQR